MPARQETLRTGLLAAALVLLLVLVFFGPGIASGTRQFFTHDIGSSDIWHMNYPAKDYYKERLSEGSLPLWCPLVGTGFPLAAQSEVGALYPPNLVLFSLLPVPLAFNWSLLLHLIAAGAFAAMLAREVGANRGAALLAGVVFAFCGFFLAHLKHPAILSTAVWLPLLLLLVRRIVARPTPGGAAALAATTGVMILAGHFQITYQNLLITVAWCLGMLLRACWKRRGVGAAVRPGLTLLAGGALGLLLGAPQILLTHELTQVSERAGGMDRDTVTHWNYEWRHLGTFVNPRMFGVPGTLEPQPALDDSTGEPLLHPRTGAPLEELVGFREERILFWQITGYVGLLPLLLVIAGLVLGWRRPAVVGFAVLAVVSVLIMLGPNGGVFHALWVLVPGFDLFRFQNRWIVHVDLALAILCSLGLTLALSRVRPAYRVGATGLAIAVSMLDLWLALGHHNPTIDTEQWLAPPDTALRIAEADGPPSRLLVNDAQRTIFRNAYYRAGGWSEDLTPYDVAKEMLHPNLNLLYRIPSISFYYPLYPRWMYEAQKFMYYPDGRLHPDAAALYNIGYVTDAKGTDTRGLTTVATLPGDVLMPEGVIYRPPLRPPFHVRLLRNTLVLPRAFLVPDARWIKDSDPDDDVTRAMRILGDPEFEPRETVLLNRPGGRVPDTADSGAPLADRRVTLVHEEPEELRFTATASRPCWLYLSDTYYPGWTATVNGEPTTIYRANISGRAVALPAGASKITFRYEPDSFRHGLLAAALGLAGWLALLVQSRRLRARAALVG